MLKTLPVLAAIAASAVLVLPTASLASPASANDVETVTATVSYADLNLGNVEGSNALLGRIKTAAHEICGMPRPVELADVAASRECLDGAMASAQPAFDEAVAAARHGTVTVTTGASLIVTAPRQ